MRFYSLNRTNESEETESLIFILICWINLALSAIEGENPRKTRGTSCSRYFLPLRNRNSRTTNFWLSLFNSMKNSAHYILVHGSMIDPYQRNASKEKCFIKDSSVLVEPERHSSHRSANSTEFSDDRCYRWSVQATCVERVAPPQHVEQLDKSSDRNSANCECSCDSRRDIERLNRRERPRR